MSVATDYYHVFISPIPTIYLQLKYPNRSYLFLYKTKDRYSIFPMNIDLLIILRCSFHSFKKILCKTQSSHDVLFTLVSTITLFTYCIVQILLA